MLRIVLTLILLLFTSAVIAQVTITDRVDIKPRGQSSGPDGLKGKIAEPGQLFYPVLRSIGNGEYLVLKSGTLKFYFDDAETYGIDNIEEHVLSYSVNGLNTSIQESVEISEYLGGPIVVREGADITCSENQTYFRFQETIPIGPTDDTWIHRNRPTDNHGGSNLLEASGIGSLSDPDGALKTTYLQFGIGQVETNARLDDSYFLIQSDTIITTIAYPFYLYRVNGPWSEETLTYQNRPPTDASEYITVTTADTTSGLKYTFSKDITPFTQGWLNGSVSDYGIRIASSGQHLFSSKESFLTFPPTVGLNLSLPVEPVNPILDLGYVEAGDTLNVHFLDFSHSLEYNFTFKPDSIEAEHILSFSKNSGCQASDFLNLYPFIEEAANTEPFFEFVLNRELTIPLDTVPVQEIYIEPRIQFENGTTMLPGNLFTFLDMELYDVSFLEAPDGSYYEPIALLDGDPFGGVPIDAYQPGEFIEVLTIPPTADSTFKIRVVGQMYKGLQVSKRNPNATEQPGDLNRDLYRGMEEALTGIHSNIEDDPYCGIPEPFAGEDGFFVSCFEFTIENTNSIIAEARPDKIAPGDTTLIDLSYLNEQGDTLAFPSDQIFDAGIEEGYQPFGTLLRPDATDTADVLLETLQGFSFIANSTAPDTTIPVLVFTEFNGQPLIDSAKITIRSESMDILLGESKFFYAKEDPEDEAGLLIKELNVEAHSKDPITLPAGGLADAFSGDDIIEEISGGKSGVYWERKRALIDDNGAITVQTLPDGVVRVIGRYWEDGKAYKVRLKASSVNRTGELAITVVRPDKLGEDDNQRIYTDALEVEHNLDSLAITYGGRTGMPPQFLKGIISQESSRLASYRYEPDLDYTYQMDDQPWKIRARNSMQQNPYWIIDANDVGNPSIPMNHTVYDGNQNIIPYPGFNGTIYDLFNQKRVSEIDNRVQVTEVLDSLRTTSEQELINQNMAPSLIEFRKEELAQERLNQWLQNTYRGGLSNIAKQTRIIASYGPMQLIYLFGYYEAGYSVSDQNLPETLNENEDLALIHSLRFFIRSKFNNPVTRNNVLFSNNALWPEGFEESLRRGANLYNGNGGGNDAYIRYGYGNKVWLKVLNYHPIK